MVIAQLGVVHVILGIIPMRWDGINMQFCREMKCIVYMCSFGLVWTQTFTQILRVWLRYMGKISAAETSGFNQNRIAEEFVAIKACKKSNISILFQVLAECGHYFWNISIDVFYFLQIICSSFSLLNSCITIFCHKKCVLPVSCIFQAFGVHLIENWCPKFATFRLLD